MVKQRKKVAHFGYIRVSTDKQTTDNQKLVILEYSQKNKFIIDRFIESNSSSSKTHDKRNINLLMDSVKIDDVIIISELSRIGRSVSDVIFIINSILEKGVILHVIKENLIIDKKNDAFSNFQIAIFSAFGELEKNIISQRTTEALRSRKLKGIKLGKPKGVIQSSIYDNELDTIKKLFLMDVSIKKIYEKIEIGTYQSLYKYITKRKKEWLK